MNLNELQAAAQKLRDTADQVCPRAAAEPVAKLLDLIGQDVQVTHGDCDKGCDGCGFHEWTVHNDRYCDMPINVRGLAEGEWCECPQIVTAFELAKAINGSEP